MSGAARRGPSARIAAALAAGSLLGVGVAAIGVPGVAVESAFACDPEVFALVEDEPSAFARLGVPQAQQISRGAGVTVAVVDSGIATGNPHFSTGVLPGTSTFDSAVPATEDTLGHGTVVAGTIAARAIDGSGVLGVAPEALLLPVRAFTWAPNNETEPGDTPDGEVAASPAMVAAGIRYAAEQGAQIINVAQSHPTDIPELADAVAFAQEQGALIVASAGNVATADPADLEAEEPQRYPAAYEGVLGVSAVDEDGLWDPAASFAGPHVDVVAQGSSVLSTFYTAGDCNITQTGGGPSASFATGYVSGAAALVAAAYPQESADQWAYRLMATASRPSPAERSDEMGWGEIRPYEALTLVDDGSILGPPSPVYVAQPVSEPTPPDLSLPQAEDPFAAARVLVVWVCVGAVSVALVALVLGRRGSKRGGRGGASVGSY